jgi:hypothetical protein
MKAIERPAMPTNLIKFKLSSLNKLYKFIKFRPICNSVELIYIIFVENFIMKQIILILGLTFFYGCSSNEKQIDEKTISEKVLQRFGDSISEQNAEPAEKLLSLMSGKDSLPLKMSGKITDVCQKKGCWMEVDLGSGKTIRVTFKDYAFFVPKDAAGKTAIINGYAKIDSISVAQLKEYASDAKKSKEDIDAINKPETELSFEANGVIIK